MVDRLLVDLGVDGRISVSTCLDGELPRPADEPVELGWPLDTGELEDLRWYLEDYLRVPFAVYEDRGSRIADRFPEWGRTLFDALFGAGPARDAYVAVRSRTSKPGQIELVLRSDAPGWLGLPWELLRDPNAATPIVLDGIALSRSLSTSIWGNTFAVGGTRLRVLMVISRPAGVNDVGYRMIARPLLERLAAVRGQVDLQVLRPATMIALEATLREAREAGNPFQIVHFDGHGVLTGPRAGVASSYADSDGQGVLVFEKPTGGADPVLAESIAEVLAEAQVPVVVLNACQSGAVGKQLEAAVATRLLAGGASAVVAMAYSVYAVAAAEFMTAFYERLFAGEMITEAVRAGRERMARRPSRPSPKGELPLSDWVIPVHYLRQDVHFPELRSTSTVSGLDETLDHHRAGQVGKQGGAMAGAEEFVGRDGLLYTVDVALRGMPVVVLHGPAGAGKTELARAFGRWWRDTGGVDGPESVIWHSFEPGVASFGLDGVISSIGRALDVDLAAMASADRRDVVRAVLQERRLLLIWDNFESVFSMPDPTSATPSLDAVAREELRGFLSELGGSAVLITSRTPEPWLGEVLRIEVGGLDSDEAVEYADQLLRPYPAAASRRESRAFGELLEWLHGHPLSMRLTLPLLDTIDPATILAGLHGTRPLPADAGNERTTSLAASITYSISHLSPETRKRLVAVSLFHGVVNADVLGILSGLPSAPRRFRGLDTDGWVTVLDEVVRVGLLTELGGGIYGIHPALPAFLAQQWRTEDGHRYEEHREAATRALLDAYADSCAWLDEEIDSGNAAMAYRVIELQRRMMGHLLGY